MGLVSDVRPTHRAAVVEATEEQRCGNGRQHRLGLQANVCPGHKDISLACDAWPLAAATAPRLHFVCVRVIDLPPLTGRFWCPKEPNAAHLLRNEPPEGRDCTQLTPVRSPRGPEPHLTLSRYSTVSLPRPHAHTLTLFRHIRLLPKYQDDKRRSPHVLPARSTCSARHGGFNTCLGDSSGRTLTHPSPHRTKRICQNRRHTWASAFLTGC